MRDTQPVAPDERWTLATMPQWFYLVGLCSNCSHEGQIDKWDLMEKVGRHAKPVVLGRLLRCTRCGNKKFNTMAAKPLPR